MARPKKANNSDFATVKIENAFWRLLEEEAFSDITVLRISQESGVNRNSFYYHYEDMNDLARKAFKSNAGPEVSKALFGVLFMSLQGEKTNLAKAIEPMLISHARKIMLCAGSDSVFLNQMVHDLLKEIWLDELSIREDLLSPKEQLQIRFVFAGLVSVLGSPEVREAPELMMELARTELGETAIAALKSIAESPGGIIHDY